MWYVSDVKGFSNSNATHFMFIKNIFFLKTRISFQQSYTFLLAHSETAEVQFSKPKRSSHFSIAFSTCQTGKWIKIVFSIETNSLYL